MDEVKEAHRKRCTRFRIIFEKILHFFHFWYLFFDNSQNNSNRLISVRFCWYLLLAWRKRSIISLKKLWRSQGFLNSFVVFFRWSCIRNIPYFKNKNTLIIFLDFIFSFAHSLLKFSSQKHFHYINEKLHFGWQWHRLEHKNYMSSYRMTNESIRFFSSFIYSCSTLGIEQLIILSKLIFQR